MTIAGMTERSKRCKVSNCLRRHRQYVRDASCVGSSLSSLQLPCILTQRSVFCISQVLFTFLPEFRLSLLDGSDDHVTCSGSWQPVEARTNAVDGNDEQVLGARVVGAVHHCTDWQSQGHAELGTLCSLRHLGNVDCLVKRKTSAKLRMRVGERMCQWLAKKRAGRRARSANLPMSSSLTVVPSMCHQLLCGTPRKSRRSCPKLAPKLRRA